MATFVDPVLGTLEHEFIESGWIGTAKTPAFVAFKYLEEDASECRLMFEAETEVDVPTPAAMELARRVVTNHAQLVTTITRALWEDFNGRGPDSGIWWHGDLETINGWGNGLPPITGPEVLLQWMLPRQIIVYHPSQDATEPPLVEIHFAAGFEEEHDVGILTDGVRVLGTGYYLDREPFKGW